MSASISFPPLTDENILWQNRAAAEAFFTAMFVDSAGVGAEGSVEQAAAISYTFTSLSNTDYVVVNSDDGVSTVQLPSKAAYDELRASYVTLATAFQQLLVNLRNAGILQP